MQKDGSIAQAEITSCGLNGGPLQGRGEYEARIACNLTSRKGGRFHKKPLRQSTTTPPILKRIGRTI